jgi:hypothetical protein
VKTLLDIPSSKDNNTRTSVLYPRGYILQEMIDNWKADDAKKCKKNAAKRAFKTKSIKTKL